MRTIGLALTATISLLAFTPATLEGQASAASEERDGFFWGVLDGVGRGAPGCEAFADRLERALTRLPDAELEKFAGGWAAWWSASYRWDLWGAAYLINGGASDDGFDYFRGWLLTRGSRQWKMASGNPDTAFDDVKPGTVAECEEILAVLPTVYEARFHKDAPESELKSPVGSEWKEADLPQRFPHLARRFAGRG